MIRLMVSASQSIMSAQLNVSQIMSPGENFLTDAVPYSMGHVRRSSVARYHQSAECKQRASAAGCALRPVCCFQ